MTHDRIFAVTTVNHLSYASNDYKAAAPNPDGGLMIRDPNGLQIGIAGKA